MKTNRYKSGAARGGKAPVEEIPNLPESPRSADSAILNELLDCVDNLVLLLDSNLKIIKANREASVSLGYSSDELTDKHFSFLVEEEERKRMVKFVRRTKGRRCGETSFLTRAYHKLHLYFSLSPIGDGENKPDRYILIGRFVGEQDSLRGIGSANCSVERILKGSSEPIFVLDGPSRTVLECNEAASELFGFDREEFIGRRLLDHSPTEKDRERNESLMARADTAYAEIGFFREQMFFPHKFGPPVPCDLIGIPFFNSDGSLAFVIVMLFDHSSEEDREAELVRILERANSLTSSLAAIVHVQKSKTVRRLSSLGFTTRQIEIARLVVLGASSKDIGFRLGIAESTVRNHLSVMFRKLGVDSRLGFVHFLTEQRIQIA